MRHNLASALEYARLNLRVFPLRPESKTPAIRRWQHLATTDERQIRRWFDRMPDANVAIMPVDGLYAIDVDPRNGGDESLALLLDGRSLPATAKALTGGDGPGSHTFFVADEPVGVIHGLLPGVDVQGLGSYVAAEPSTHPDSKREYVFLSTPGQGIARSPDWLTAIVTRRPRDHPVELVSPWQGTGVRAGDLDILFGQVCQRFPVPGRGHRNDLMVRAVASLIGRGFDDETTTCVIRRWWSHFHAAGLCGTSPSTATTEIRRTISVIRSSTTFRPSIGPDHRELCRSIVLTDGQRRLLGADVRELELAGLSLGGGTGQADDGRHGTGHGEHNTKSLSLTSRRLSDRLCETDSERAYVEALLVQAIHKVETEPGELIRMTSDQIRAVAADRGFTEKWGDGQMERLRAKYLWRPDKPATRYELLREIVKGDRKPGLVAGTPSEFLATGIKLFLAETT